MNVLNFDNYISYTQLKTKLHTHALYKILYIKSHCNAYIHKLENEIREKVDGNLDFNAQLWTQL